MPTVTLNKKVFEELIGKKLPLDELKERITYLGTDLESIEGNEISVEIFPNRPDLLSEQGLARALSSFIGVKKGLRQYDVYKSDAQIIVDKSVSKYRPCSAAAIVKGVKFTDELIKEIMQNQEKLHKTFGRNRKKVALGYYILDKVKFPVTYKAEDPKNIKFKPLHFEKEVDGLQILNQHPTGREFAHLLDGFDKFPVYYDKDGKVLSMPPIINSDEVGSVVSGVCDILIECSGFDQRILNLAINMSAATLADMGGQIFAVEIIYSDKKILCPDFTPSRMKVDINYINKRLGLNLKEEEIQKLLERMGYGYSNKTALVPAYRADILHPIDLAEDIAIAYGYENFKEEIPKVATVGQEDKFEIFQNKIANILVGLGLLEVNTYCLTNKDTQSKKMESEVSCVELANSLSLEYNVLRSWLIPNLMQVLENNKHNELPQKIFTLGKIFKKNSSEETGVEENVRLGVVSCNDQADFTEIKQYLDYLMGSLDLGYEVKEVENDSFIQGRVGRVIVKGQKVAYIGEISPKVLNNFNLTVPVVAFELNISELFKVI